MPRTGLGMFQLVSPQLELHFALAVVRSVICVSPVHKGTDLWSVCRPSPRVVSPCERVTQPVGTGDTQITDLTECSKGGEPEAGWAVIRKWIYPAYRPGSASVRLSSTWAGLRVASVPTPSPWRWARAPRSPCALWAPDAYSWILEGALCA